MSMVTINFVIAICFAILTAEVLYMAISLIVKDRAGRIAFLRSFKKGKCIIIYFSAIPLFCVGHMYAGADFFAAFFSAVDKIINLVVLKYSTATIQALFDANIFYKTTVYYSFTLVGVNALFFTLSLFEQRMWEFAQSTRAKSLFKDKLFLFGNNQNNVAIYHSDCGKNKFIIDKISEDDAYDLYTKKISYVSCRSFAYLIARIFKAVEKTGAKYTVIVNTGSEERNFEICRHFIKWMEFEKKGGREKFLDCLCIYVFGDPRYEAIYEDVMNSSYGCIRYVNKYQMIAMNFIEDYPFTKFMDERHIDYSTSLVKDDVDINVCLIGFGKTSRQIFLTSIANNQFLCRNGSEIELKKVHYHIFDKDSGENNKNLNHSYYRFRDECDSDKINKADYLPLPSLPAEEHFNTLDINDSKFYKQIKNVLLGKANGGNPEEKRTYVNFIVIAFGTDLENIDMAQKLVEKRQEWGIENLTIFVKVRSWRKADTLLEQDGCYFIGNEEESVYNIEEIKGDSIFRMAQLRNEIYDLEYLVTSNKDIVLDGEKIKQNKIDADKKWYVKLSQLERESNLYCCLSLKSKLNLIGLDYCPVSDAKRKGLTEEEYMEIYSVGDPVDTKTCNQDVSGKKIVNYTLNFVPSKRTNLAIQEHQRWNSFMISKGLVPSTIEQIRNEKTIEIDEKTGEKKEKYTNGKNYKLRRHGNITTFEGLVEFRKIITERKKNDESENDVIKYDYQLMDDAYWLLKNCGYKIVRKD